ncbi:hypothetical protein F5X68DRAFT_215951 [Plectosphaerella plurivora]|uniref:Uncharacterized protein n=1 Tax=Plectosphaerella plurivora TaxID=936078 RepID=A0A9P9A5X4_9PEZI|nr:hypothetical protein F5X68DRAFT_215951 [Plectosphaerella plurivora]
MLRGVGAANRRYKPVAARSGAQLSVGILAHAPSVQPYFLFFGLLVGPFFTDLTSRILSFNKFSTWFAPLLSARRSSPSLPSMAWSWPRTRSSRSRPGSWMPLLDFSAVPQAARLEELREARSAASSAARRAARLHRPLVARLEVRREVP